MLLAKTWHIYVSGHVSGQLNVAHCSATNQQFQFISSLFNRVKMAETSKQSNDIFQFNKQ